MSDLQIKFIKAGLQTLIQDAGRPGYQNYGVPQGGALDRQAARDANILVGNKENMPALEITLLGPELQFSHACQIAITGALLSPRLNGETIENYRLINVRANSILSFGKPVAGCRAYLAVAGDWKVKEWLGSVSPSPISAEVLTPDSMIKKDSIIHIEGRLKEVKQTPSYNPVSYPNTAKIHVMPGPEFDWFSKKLIAIFFSREHTISQEANRMGYRLDCILKEPAQRQEMISSGIIPGTIQLTAQNMPIILLADAQTTGGYPRIAVVIDEDLDRLAQLRPGNTISFKVI